MALDPYQPCLCGSGKKLKFCCGDLAPEVEKISRMIAGEQYAAALKHLRAITAKHPERVTLLGMLAMLETNQEEFEAARKTLDTLIVKQPENPRGWAELAILEAVSANGKAAVEPLQRALETAEMEISARLYLAIGVVGQALFEQGEVWAARAHFSLQSSMAPQDDHRPGMMLMELQRGEGIPLLMKSDYSPPEPPADAPWKAEFVAAIEQSFYGRWRAAERKLTSLAQKHADAPQIWRSVADLRSNLADNEGAVEALRRFARANTPLDDAVEAMSLASLLEPIQAERTVDVIRVPRALLDKDAVEAAVLSSDRVESMSLDPRSFSEQDSPPPIGLFVLFDKPIIKSAVGRELTLDEIPESLGQIYIYGRETDREARLELMARRDLAPAANALLDELAGNHLAQLGEERVLTAMSQLEATLSWRWRLPQDLPLAERVALMRENTRRTFLQAWTQLPLQALGGKSPREAAADPAMKIPLLAEILRLDLATSESWDGFDFNELRRSLELPELESIDPTVYTQRPIPLARIPRLQFEKLIDEELMGVFYAALAFRIQRALKPLALELERRESCHDQIKLSSIYGMLSSFQTDVDEALRYIERARAASREEGTSPARWDLSELELRLREAHVNEARDLLRKIQRHHMQEPGISERLFQLLMDYGIIGPDGRPVGPRPGAVSPLVEEPATATGIWTPEDATTGGEKSKLWVPGMD